ncbi:hypothetical protein Pelo_19358 [Pelomyxa schiedti]|nr:hypothetical protein Pelo_19358 [Pelomyxa schiedti]
MAEMISSYIVIDSPLDKLPLSSQANFFGEQMRTLPPHVSVTSIITIYYIVYSINNIIMILLLNNKGCAESGESAIAHCLSRRNAGLAAVNYFTHSPESLLLASLWNNNNSIANYFALQIYSPNEFPLDSRETDELSTSPFHIPLPSDIF